MRPRYETAGDYRNEVEVVNVINETWKMNAEKISKQYSRIDRCLVEFGPDPMNKPVLGMAEIKCYVKPFDHYPYFQTSAAKVAYALRLQELMEVPVFLICRWGCGTIKGIQVSKDLISGFVFGGRRDRGDEGDLEPMAKIHKRFFKELEVLYEDNFKTSDGGVL